MKIYSRNEVVGNTVKLLTTDKMHLKDEGILEEKIDTEKDFGKLLLSLIDNINALEQKAQEMEVKAVVSPEEVNVHDLMITMEQARLSLLMFKSFADRFTRMWTEFMNLR